MRISPLEPSGWFWLGWMSALAFVTLALLAISVSGVF